MLLVGKVLVAKVVLIASLFLLGLVLPAHSLLSFKPQARFLKVIAINSVTLRGLFLQVLVREIRGLFRPLYIM